MLLVVLQVIVNSLVAQPNDLKKKIDNLTISIEPKLIEWRHHLHQNPELSNREFKTAAYVEAHLRKLGLEVKTNVAHTGVVAILRGGHPGPVVALRADMDALPIKERVPLPYASTATAEYNGETVSVMHACGHDAHVAMLMASAEILSNLKESIPGTIVFLFQPAEEGAPAGEEGGAALMIKEGVLDNPKAEVIFGLHINSKLEVGKIWYRPGNIMAGVNTFTIKVKGKPSHGSSPWLGIDPIVASAQIIMGLQTIVSRQMDLTEQPVVISVGKISGGVRPNVIPEEVNMTGTIRTLDTTMQRIVFEKIRQTATNIAESMGATAEVNIDAGYPIVHNNIELTAKMLPTLYEVSGGEENIILTNPLTISEDFSFYANKIPGMFFWLGGMKKGMDPADAPPHHTPDFQVEDSAMPLGVRTLCYLALDYMAANKQ